MYNMNTEYTSVLIIKPRVKYTILNMLKGNTRQSNCLVDVKNVKHAGG